MSLHNTSMAGRLNDLVDQLNNEIYEQEKGWQNTSKPVNIAALKILHEKIGNLIRERENHDIHDYFDNQDICPINHQSFQNH